MNLNGIKNELIGDLIKREGDYVNDPTDRGGETKYGITQGVARLNGYFGDMKDLPYDLAKKIYTGKYWNSLELDLIYTISPKLAISIFDYGVNSGTSRAAKVFQRCLNVMNNKSKYGYDLHPDGIIGNITIGRYQDYLYDRGAIGEEILLNTYNAMRMSFLVSICENDTSQRKYAYGWLKRVNELLEDY